MKCFILPTIIISLRKAGFGISGMEIAVAVSGAPAHLRFIFVSEL